MGKEIIIKNIENVKVNPTFSTIIKLARALGVLSGELLK